MKLSILIPCFDEEENLAPLVQRIKQTFPEGDFECVFVDDGSRDGTAQVLKRLSVSEELDCKVICFTRNFGKEAAIYAGLAQCEGDYISLIDADLQQQPATIREMVTLLEQNPGVDMVAAVQTSRRESFWMRNCKTVFYRMMNALADIEFQPGASDFRTFRRNVAEAVLSMKESQRFSKGLFSWGGFKVCYLPYEPEARQAGKSKWPFLKLLNYAVQGIVSFSTKPLRVAVLLGVLFLLAAVVSLFVPGGSVFIFFVLATSGIQLLCLGILGEYIAGIFMQCKNRPAYLVREVYRHQGKKEKNS